VWEVRTERAPVPNEPSGGEHGRDRRVSVSRGELFVRMVKALALAPLMTGFAAFHPARVYANLSCFFPIHLSCVLDKVIFELLPIDELFPSAEHEVLTGVPTYTFVTCTHAGRTCLLEVEALS